MPTPTTTNFGWPQPDAANPASGDAARIADALEAIDSVVGSLISASIFTATSSSSVAIGTGSKTWAIPTGRGIAVGDPVKAIADTDNWMYGTVTAYDGTDLTVDVSVIAGSGTFDAWTIRVTGLRGPIGMVGARAVARFRTTANVNLAGGGLAAGTSHDGVTAAEGDLALVMSQTDPAENGVYDVPASGAATRNADYAEWAAYVGLLVTVAEGTAYHDIPYLCSANEGGTLGTTALPFAPLAAAGLGYDHATSGLAATTVQAAIDELAADLDTLRNAGHENGLINGDFDIWDRPGGTSWSTTGYGPLNRWRVDANGSTFTASRQTHALGQGIVPGNPKYFLQIAVTSVAGAGNYVRLTQRIKNVRRYAGGTITVTGFGKEAAGKSVAVEIQQNFGSGGSPSAAVSTPVGIKTLGTGFGKFGGAGFTVAVPSIAGKTLGTDGNDYIELVIWLDAGSTYASRASALGQQSATWGFSHLSIVSGDATRKSDPFAKRTEAEERRACQEFGAPVGLTYGRASAATGGVLTSEFPVPLRAVPTSLTVVNGTGTLKQIGVGNADISAPVIAAAGLQSVYYSFTSSGLTTGSHLTLDPSVTTIFADVEL